MNDWMTLTVLNSRTFEVESEIEILKSEVCLRQQYAEKPDVEIPAVHDGDGNMIAPATLERGYPAFTAISVKSGLQFRVAESIEEVKRRMNG